MGFHDGRSYSLKSMIFGKDIAPVTARHLEAIVPLQSHFRYEIDWNSNLYFPQARNAGQPARPSSPAGSGELPGRRSCGWMVNPHSHQRGWSWWYGTVLVRA
jgi:hypothetical protein